MQIFGVEQQPMHILYVEDEARIRETTATFLRNAGHTLTECENVLEALTFVEDVEPDLLLCNFNMDHGPDGLVLAERVRRLYPACPIVMISHYRTEEDLVRGLAVDVDAYIKRPCKLADMLDKIYGAIQRRRTFRPAPENQIITSGALTMDVDQRTVFWHEQPLTLTPIEFRILAQLAGHPNTVFQPVDLWATVKGVQVTHVQARNLLKAHISKLRVKLEQDGLYP